MTEGEDIQDVDSSLIINSVFNTFLSYTAIMLNIITIHALRKNVVVPKASKNIIAESGCFWSWCWLIRSAFERSMSCHEVEG